MSRRSGSRDPDLLTKNQAASALGLDEVNGRVVIDKFVKAGAIPVIKTDDGVRIHRDEVVRLAELIGTPISDCGQVNGDECCVLLAGHGGGHRGRRADGSYRGWSSIATQT